MKLMENTRFRRAFFNESKLVLEVEWKDRIPKSTNKLLKCIQRYSAGEIFFE
jgi:hypothetical protein